MHALFPQLKGEKGRRESAKVSWRCTRIFEMLQMAEKPVTSKALQAMLLANDEKWAAGRTGYLQVLELVQRMKGSGMLRSAGSQGITVATDIDLVAVFSDALATFVRENIPDAGVLGELKKGMGDLVLYYQLRRHEGHGESGAGND